MLEQRKKLQQTLALIVQHIQHPEVLGGMLQELGQRDVTYGIRPEHYPLVGAVLLESFSDFLGRHWTHADHDALVKGYEAVSSLMLQAAQEPPAAWRVAAG